LYSRPCHTPSACALAPSSYIVASTCARSLQVSAIQHQEALLLREYEAIHPPAQSPQMTWGEINEMFDDAEGTSRSVRIHSQTADGSIHLTGLTITQIVVRSTMRSVQGRTSPIPVVHVGHNAKKGGKCRCLLRFPSATLLLTHPAYDISLLRANTFSRCRPLAEVLLEPTASARRRLSLGFLLCLLTPWLT